MDAHGSEPIDIVLDDLPITEWPDDALEVRAAYGHPEAVQEQQRRVERRIEELLRAPRR